MNSHLRFYLNNFGKGFIERILKMVNILLQSIIIKKIIKQK